MKYAEILAGLVAQRTEKLASLQSLHSTLVTENRTPTAAEQTSFDELRAQIGALDKQIENTKAMEALTGNGAVSVVPQPGEHTQEQRSAAGLPAGSTVVRNLPKGTSFTRYAMALASSKGNLMQAAETAKQWEGSTPEVSRVLKAAVAAGTTTDSTWAAPLVDYKTMASEFIDLLRPQTILGQMQGLRRVPFRIRIPRQTSGASVGWVGEGNPKPVSKHGFDTVELPQSKIAGIVVITMELARFSDPSAEALVRDDMVEAIASFSDAQFINPAVAAVSGTNPGSITNGATAAASTGSTLAEIEADLLTARLAMVNANLPLAGCYWIMNPATRIFLEELRTSQDVLAFPNLSEKGTLKGIPVVTSNSVGTYDSAEAGGARKYIALVSAPNVLLADDGQVMLDASAEASIVMTEDGAGSTLTSLWQKNMIGIRAERLIHWLRRRTQAAYVITDVTY